MQQFELGLKDNRQKRYLQFLLFSILLNITLFSWLSLTAIHLLALTTGMILSIAMLIIHVTKKWNNLNFTPHYYLIILLICWLFALELIPALLNLIFIFSALYLHKKISVSVDSTGIIIHSFPKKIFAWQDADNVLIKDGLMTIDLLNNKIFQLAVDDNLVNENDFNDFCRHQILKQKAINKQNDNFAG